MILQNLTTLVSVSLPNDLLWVDEFSWSPNVGSAQYSLSGALILQSGAKLLGREITLQPPDESLAWVPRSVVQNLRQWLQSPDLKMRLTFEYPTDTRQFVVGWRNAEVPLEARPITGDPSHGASDWFSLTLRFLEIE